MTTSLVAVHLFIAIGDRREAEVADVLREVPTQGMRKYAGAQSALIDWAIVGEDMASSIAAVDLPGDYAPDRTAFPAGPSKPLRRSRRRGYASA